MKNNVICSTDKRTLWLSQTYYGSVLDKKICDEQPLKLLSGIFMCQDTDFIGHHPENVAVLMPQKNQKEKELSKEKSLNKEIYSIRIGVEHTISGAKRWRIAK